MAKTSIGQATRPADWDPVLRSLLFWSFVGVALLLFAACVLLPEWQKLREVQAQRDAMRDVASALQARVNQQQREADAVRSSPVVLERILERELHYRRPDERELILLSPLREVVKEARREPDRASNVVPRMPAWLAARLPDGPWVSVFYKSPDRSVCLVLSGILLISAFWLFSSGERRSFRWH